LKSHRKKTHFFNSIEGPFELEIEQRIFNISAFSISVFAFVGTLLNYIIGLNLIVVGLSFLGGLVAFYLYYLSRYKNRYSNKLIAYYMVAIISILGIMFFYNNGLGGTVAYLIIVLLNVFILVVPEKYLIPVVIILYLFLVSLFLFELKFPYWVTPYVSKEEAVIDHITTLFYSMALTTYVFINFRNKMHKDRREILQKNEEIEFKRKEIQESKYDLEKNIIELKGRNQFIETLLQELSHRVKNNLQLVISLLDMQIGDDESSARNSYVQETKNRLTALILVHQRLYGEQTGVAIFMPDYIRELGESIDFLNQINSDGIITYNIEPVELQVEKVISLGLIINEIITNSFKHAFKFTENPQILISFNYTTYYKLKISDNGSGFINTTKKNRTGMSLINSLTKQLNGDLYINSEIGKGSTFILTFK